MLRSRWTEWKEYNATGCSPFPQFRNWVILLPLSLSHISMFLAWYLKYWNICCWILWFWYLLKSLVKECYRDFRINWNAIEIIRLEENNCSAHCSATCEFSEVNICYCVFKDQITVKMFNNQNIQKLQSRSS